jgi:hypothetical protein
VRDKKREESRLRERERERVGKETGMPSREDP